MLDSINHNYDINISLNLISDIKIRFLPFCTQRFHNVTRICKTLVCKPLAVYQI